MISKTKLTIVVLLSLILLIKGVKNKSAIIYPNISIDSIWSSCSPDKPLLTRKAGITSSLM